MIGITGQVVEGGRNLIKTGQKALARKKSPLSVADAASIAGLIQQIEHYCKLADRVIDQARRRGLEGEQVPTQDKVYSIFEPHTDLIKRGKAQKPVEFGRKAFFTESARDLITSYQVLVGNPADSTHVQGSLDRHKQTFQAAPEVGASKAVSPS